MSLYRRLHRLLIRNQEAVDPKTARGRIGTASFGVPASEAAVVESEALVGEAYVRRVERPDVSPELRNEFEHYRLERRIGAGGFGEVFLATQTFPVERPVAIKLLHRSHELPALDRFRREAQLLARLQHPNIAVLYDVSQTRNGRIFYSMEFVDGFPIDQFCDASQLSIEERIRLIIPVCEAVGYLHLNALVHRDITPRNILVAGGGSRGAIAKVIDFGLAKLLDEASGTAETVAAGTPAYASLEQMQGGTITTQTDVYGLGAVLYQLLIGSPPIQASTVGKAVLDLTHGAIDSPAKRIRAARNLADLAASRNTSPEKLLRDTSGDIVWILQKALDTIPGQRYRTGSELAEDLGRLLRVEPVLARGGRFTYQASRFVRRNRGKVIAATTAALLLITIPAITRSWTRAQELAHQRAETRASIVRGSQKLANSRLGGARADSLKREYDALLAATKDYVPIWARARELALFDTLLVTRAAVSRDLNESLVLLTNAVEQAPTPADVSDAKQALEAMYWYLYQEQDRGVASGLGQDLLASLIADLDVGTHREAIEGTKHFTLVTEPADAEVHCYRYVDVDRRRTPLPYDAQTGRTEQPRLVVEHAEGISACFSAGDTVLFVNGAAVSTESAFAHALIGVTEGRPVTVTVADSLGRRELTWIPYPSAASAEIPVEARFDANGPSLNLRVLFGLRFAAYPFWFTHNSRLETNQQIELPRGSYLFVARRAGCETARLPVSIPFPEDTIRIELSSRRPPGDWVYVASGYAEIGGDPGAFQSDTKRRVPVESFWMARCEVTNREYGLFLNDQGVIARTDDSGMLLPVDPAVIDELAGRGLTKKVTDDQGLTAEVPQDRFQVGAADWTRGDDGSWTLLATTNPDYPVLNVCLFAAREYAAWMTRRFGGQWTVRVPNDVEWEWAARGADRRIYVWGDYMVWNYGWSLNAQVGTGTPGPVGVSPCDESVFGVRDMCGSASELTISQPFRYPSFRSRRGGHWTTRDEFEFRLATRNSLLPERRSTSNGIRVVAKAVGAETP